jgi:hypothetical protein
MQAAPWWFSGVTGIVGILVGAFIKWVFDTRTERKRLRREDNLRFIAQKQEAYGELLSLFELMVKARVTNWVNERQAKNAALPEEQRQAFETSRKQQQAIISENMVAVEKHLKTVRLLSPKNVYDVAATCVELLHIGSRSDFELAEAQFTFAARRDLGMMDPEAEWPQGVQAEPFANIRAISLEDGTIARFEELPGAGVLQSRGKPPILPKSRE